MRVETVKPSLDIPKARESLEALLTLEGSSQGTYSRFYRYSLGNLAFLAMQNCPPEPVATFNKWKDLGRHVQKGEKAYSILRPINVKVETPDNSDEQFKMIRRYKIVRALFAVSQTAGQDLPPYEPPHWSKDRALKELDIEEGPFDCFDGNIQGFSHDRIVAVSPVAAYPFKTLIHEVGHVSLGHTTESTHEEYLAHRGHFEFEAESAAHLVLTELGATDHFNQAESRLYVQSWLRDEKPTEASMNKVIKTSDTIIRAGYDSGQD